VFATVAAIAGLSHRSPDVPARAAIPYLDEPWYC
jgi:hypothetical protein